MRGQLPSRSGHRDEREDAGKARAQACAFFVPGRAVDGPSEWTPAREFESPADPVLRAVNRLRPAPFTALS
ncbi:hypothetical protein LMG28614_05345 [Paraburkholderia ultramafica]|uniref:Uncharacterized protein n=1 Tax=Paraburkholderia ultramafica TaxID=1544867 RepID=A0A6S7BIF2_9BURK|nr:hypothetical protein LMG28614_05345 [Paraburkholderia ultramafica]